MLQYPRSGEFRQAGHGRTPIQQKKALCIGPVELGCSLPGVPENGGMEKERVAFITGGTGGLGRSVSGALVTAGFRTVVGYGMHEKDLGGLDQLYPGISGLQFDATEPNATESAFSDLGKKFGRLDVLVHVAGGFAGGTPLTETTIDVFDHMMNLNTRSTFLVLKNAFALMKKNSYGRIVTIGARPALDGAAGLSAYAASKAAVVNLTRTASAEGKEFGITANCVLPSTIDTPANRKSMPKANFDDWVKPERLAHIIASLVAEAAGDTSGAVIPVYGRA